VPVGSPLKQALDAYLPERETVLRRRKQQSQALFFECKHPSCSQSRWFATLPREPEPINVRTIRRVLLRVCKAKGLEPMYPHLLRHACATHMLNNGAALVVTRELLGHAKLSTTAQYAFVSVVAVPISIRYADQKRRFQSGELQSLSISFITWQFSRHGLPLLLLLPTPTAAVC